jgi:hypothetical protein
MIPDLILDVILDVILHGFGAIGRASIRPCEQVLGTGSIMSKRRRAEYPDRLLAKAE